MTFVIESYQSKGLRDDKGRKFVPADYFYNIENMNYDGITGCQRIKAPNVVYNVGSACSSNRRYLCAERKCY